MARSERRSGGASTALLLALAASSAAGCGGAGPAGPRAALDRAPKLERRPLTVVPGVHMLGGLSPSAAYAVETSAGLLLFDSGLDADAKALKEQMAGLGLHWRKVVAIFLTHAHGDHAGGADALRAATGAKVYAGEGDAAVLRAGRPREAFFSTFHMPDREPHPTTVDVPLKGGERLDFGEAAVRAVAAPGHTPGSTCYLVERGGLRMLFAGDVILMLRGDETPRSELGKPLGTYSAYLAPRYRGDAKTYLASLRVLRSMPVPDLVFPGHPRADNPPQSPRLSQARWAAMLDGGIRDMETLLARYEADGADFLDGTPKVLLPDFFYLGDFRGSALYGFVAGPKLYVVDAPGGPGLADALDRGMEAVGLRPRPPAAVLLTSCDDRATAGLGELIGRHKVQVVAAAGGIPSLRESCPAGTDFIPAEELPARGWFPVEAFALEGRGAAPAAYLLTTSGKRVLCSGMIPVRMSQAVGERLIADLTRPPGSPRGYAASLARLALASPNLWLPAVPTDDQNANVYDQEWQWAMMDNFGVVQFLESRANRR
ncbi:Metallo-beta-lactamase L1 precursor [Aquisphaera giovannonii]|uniref:Metallo-beta-lactamase L1 n=1 Tax=Aquisphaera giovannonii TaxID=406548 RepID=A0A5B9W5N9_9BACT|nr:MBL fold metallo-hydrolase [Aquisphaera giovannonii]QEH35291.1 Metallo-beta-lactamase L1 precursor [Aquisphaera giovannonii]